MTRLDQKQSTLLDMYNAKKIFVVDISSPPQFLHQPELNYELRSGFPLEI